MKAIHYCRTCYRPICHVSIIRCLITTGCCGCVNGASWLSHGWTEMVAAMQQCSMARLIVHRSDRSDRTLPGRGQEAKQTDTRHDQLDLFEPLFQALRRASSFIMAIHRWRIYRHPTDRQRFDRPRPRLRPRPRPPAPPNQLRTVRQKRRRAPIH